MSDNQTQDTIMDADLVRIDAEKQSAYNYRERRHDDWADNYTLSRDKIITNRLTQRQTINIPLMKYGLATVLKDIDEPPMISFTNLSNNEDKEIMYNEYWKENARLNKLVIRDRASKKHLCLYGRSFKKLNICDGRFKFDVVLPEDMLVDRYVDPLDIDSARILIQINIFRTLSQITENEEYDKEAREKIKRAFDAETAKVESESNINRMMKQNDKLRTMGVKDIDDPVVGTTYIELNEVYRKEYDEKLEQEIIIVYVVATTDNGMFKLSKKPLHEIVGSTEENAWYDHYPYTTAAADPEADDFWSDAPADTLRQPNKVLNSFASSMVENRVLKNFNMHYYDSSNANFIPQTFVPGPFAWFPMPGDPHKMAKDVEVGDLSESLDEMQFLIGIAEKAVAATSVQTGELPASQVKLGQTELALSNAKDRTKSMLVPIQQEWEDFAQKYNWLMEAAYDKVDDLKTHRRGREGKMMYTKIIGPEDWYDKSGYIAEVKTREDKDSQDVAAIQKLQVAKEAMPNNVPLVEIYKKHLLDFAGLKSEEMKEVMDFERSNPMPQIDPMTGQPIVNGQLVPQNQQVNAGPMQGQVLG